MSYRMLTTLGLLIATLMNPITLLAADDNPFVNAQAYVNPDYASEVNDFFKRNPDYQTKASQLKLLDTHGQWNMPTAIWLDSMQAIMGNPDRGTHGVQYYLEDALKKSENQRVITLSFVIYDLPLRDCAAYSSNGEFKSPSDLSRYKSDYIDKIQAILNQFYQNPAAKQWVRVALMIEPDSLPNMITNADLASCQIAANQHIYTDGIKYALSQFSMIPTVYLYLDIAHSGWLGWSHNMNLVTSVYNNKVLGPGFNYVRGFVTDTSNYTPVQEAFSYADYFNKGIRQSKFYNYNDSYDEASYIGEIMSLDASGQLNQDSNQHIIEPSSRYYQNFHFLIDTSRNQWLTNTLDYQAENYQNQWQVYPRLDQRHHRGNWCNVQFVQPTATHYDNPQHALIPSRPSSSALGYYPVANPSLINPLYQTATGDHEYLPIDAYVWIKPPGEGDGFYDPSTGLGDQMCGAGDGGSHNDQQSTDSIQDGSKPAPKAGVFFDNAFKQLIDVRGCIDNVFSSSYCPNDAVNQIKN